MGAPGVNLAGTPGRASEKKTAKGFTERPVGKIPKVNIAGNYEKTPGKFHKRTPERNLNETHWEIPEKTPKL